MKIKLMFDNHRYISKPTAQEAGAIQNRIAQAEMTIEELAHALSSGATFKPALLKGRKSTDWISQQLFALDFDEGTTIEEELTKCKECDIIPVFGYTSFSHTEEQHKFRLVFCMDKVITDIEERNNIQSWFSNTFDKSDQVAVDPGRMFYGGKRLIEGNYNSRIEVDRVGKGKEISLDDSIIQNTLYYTNKKAQSKWQEKQIEIYETNIELLLSNEFDELYPDLSKLLRYRKSDLIMMHNFAKVYVKDDKSFIKGVD